MRTGFVSVVEWRDESLLTRFPVFVLGSTGSYKRTLSVYNFTPLSLERRRVIWPYFIWTSTECWFILDPYPYFSWVFFLFMSNLWLDLSFPWYLRLTSYSTEPLDPWRGQVVGKVPKSITRILRRLLVSNRIDKTWSKESKP